MIDTALLRALLKAANWERLYAVGPDGDELATDLVQDDSVYGPAVASADVSWIHDDRGGYSREEMNAKLRAIAEAVNALPGLLDENERLIHAIERDRSTMADCVTAIKTQLDSRFWLTEGRGSYEWNDDRYRQEFYSAAVSLLAAIKPIERVAADLTNSPRESFEVQEARRDLLAENQRLRAVIEILHVSGLVEREKIDQAERIYWSTKEASIEWADHPGNDPWRWAKPRPEKPPQEAL